MSFHKSKTLNQTREYVNQETTLTMYKTLVLPISDYCDIGFYHISQELSEKPESLQNSACHTMPRTVDEIGVNEKHELLKLHKLSEKHGLLADMQAYSSATENSTEYLKNLIIS